MNESQLEVRFEAPDAEQLVQCVLSGLSDEQIDLMEVEREYKEQDDLISEPVTVVAVISATSLTVAWAVVRIVEKYLENKRQYNALITIAHAPPDARAHLEKVAESNNQVTIAYGKPDPPNSNQQK